MKEMFNSLYEINSKLINELVQKREQQIIDRLEKCGYKFDTRQELEEFAKTRMKLHSHHNNYYELFVDDMLIAHWTDKIKIDFNGCKITVTR